MDSENKTHRTYNETEVGGLIQRATQLHEKASGESDSKLTLDEIEHIAADLGVPPEHLEAAALELEDRRDSPSSFSLWGGPFVTNQSRVVKGKMTEEQWNDVVLELRRFSGNSGETSKLGRSYQWSDSVGEFEGGLSFEKTQVTLRPGEDRTSVQIRKHYQGAALLYPAAFLVTAFVSLMVFHSMPDIAKVTELALAGLSGVGSLGAVRAFISWGTKRHTVKIANLADRIRDRLSFTEPSPDSIPDPDSPVEQIGLEDTVSPSAEDLEDETYQVGRRSAIRT